MVCSVDRVVFKGAQSSSPRLRAGEDSRRAPSVCPNVGEKVEWRFGSCFACLRTHSRVHCGEFRCHFRRVRAKFGVRRAHRWAWRSPWKSGRRAAPTRASQRSTKGCGSRSALEGAFGSQTMRMQVGLRKIQQLRIRLVHNTVSRKLVSRERE